MKALDIAIKDLKRSFRSASAVVFMFGIPLLVTGMFYMMFGSMAQNGGFDLPKTKVIIANMDAGGPRFQINPKNIPGGRKAKTMGDLIVSILESDDLKDLIEITSAPDPQTARASVDNQQAQVAIIIPTDFSKQFADVRDGKAVIEFYQDPTLTIGPAIMRSILNRFLDSMGGVSITINTFLDEADASQYNLVSQVIQRYLDTSLALSDNLERDLLDIRVPAGAKKSPEQDKQNILLSIVGPIMAGMLIFYAFFTGTSSAQSILREEEERTLPRLFTTPTRQSTILTGKLLSVFMTVFVQVVVLLIVSHLIFGIQWGAILSIALVALGTIFSAASFGIFVNSFLKNTKQAGVLFGGVLTVTGMVGMMSVIGGNSSGAVSTSLLVPQGWAIRGLTQSMHGEPIHAVLITLLTMLAWGAVFFIVGVLRFNRRYV